MKKGKVATRNYSRGVVFVEFTEHQHTLVALRVRNNYPGKVLSSAMFDSRKLLRKKKIIFFKICFFFFLRRDSTLKMHFFCDCVLVNSFDLGYPEECTHGQYLLDKLC